MNDNITWVELARVPIAKTQDLLLARFVGRDAAAKIGLPPAVLTRLSTVISEITRNVVQHAGCEGDIQIGQIADGKRIGLRIIVSDKGRGIDHPERFLAEDKLRALGAGLPGARKLVDQFDIQSAPGEGTTVTMEFWKQEEV